MKIPLDKIDLPVHDLRAEIDLDELETLANSLRVDGQLQAIGIVQSDGERFEVVFGARRTRAARLLGWTDIEANIVEQNEGENVTAKKLAENVHRQQLTPVEEAHGLMAMVVGETPDVRELVRRTGKSPEWVKGRLEIAYMPDLLQQALQSGRLTIGVCREFANIDHERALAYFIEHAIRGGCSVDQARAWSQQAQAVVAGLDNSEGSDNDFEQAIQTAEYARQMAVCSRCREAHEMCRMTMLTVCKGCFDAVLNDGSQRESARTANSNGSYSYAEHHS